MLYRVAFCLICCLGSLTGQNDPFHAQTPFRVQTEVVQIPVGVTDKNGRSIDGLVARDFTVLDDGFPLEITLDTFGKGSAPISLAIVIQRSRVSARTLTKIGRIGGMIQPLVIGLRGEAAVVMFDSEITWLQDFTSDDIRIRQALNNLKPRPSVKQAQVLDAIVAVADRMKERKGRRVLLLVSESRDQGSETTFQHALETVEREGIEVFGADYSAYATTWIGNSKDPPDLSLPRMTSEDPSARRTPPSTLDFVTITAELIRLGQRNAVQALTKATGGSDYPFVTVGGIEHVIERLGVEVHSQYMLNFRPRENAGGRHQIDVSVPNRADLRIQSRRAYWAEREGDTYTP
jgi:VWFA-related protein